MEKVPVGDRGEFCFWRSFFPPRVFFLLFFLKDKGTFYVFWEAEKERSDAALNRGKGALVSRKASVKVKSRNPGFIDSLVAKS